MAFPTWKPQGARGPHRLGMTLVLVVLQQQEQGLGHGLRMLLALWLQVTPEQSGGEISMIGDSLILPTRTMVKKTVCSLCQPQLWNDQVREEVTLCLKAATSQEFLATVQASFTKS